MDRATRPKVDPLSPLNVTIVDGGNDNFTTQVDNVSTSLMTYIGKAAVGASTASAVWQIQRVDESGTPITVVIKWADGDDSFNNIWNNRTSLSYS